MQSEIVKKPLALLAFISIPAAADPYQWEVGGDYQSKDYDSVVVGDGDDYKLWGAYYLSPVTTDKGPLAEAAFLSRASNISIDLTNEQYSSDYSYEYRVCTSGSNCMATHYGRSMENNKATLGFEYYLPASWLYVAGSYQYLDRSYESKRSVGGQPVFSQSSSTHEYWSASVGVTPLAGWLLAAQFGEGGDGELFEGDAAISSKYLWQLGGDRALNVEGTYFVDNGYNDWQIGADFYFSKTLSLGASYADNQSSEIRLKKFVTDSIALEASYIEFEEDYGYQSGDGFTVGVSTRF
ncbi:putative porin [Gilvimarinus sp. DA14]|uniref:putative porin n=1 Tax=Gilvimarinus sp. DA14 TaxID=2956798 RepID=UPI0020B7A40F|nr:putative porin [Gilvimarinus sp. DA14]UTF60074.1 putative porin [Gilvimarinus sp. DA14]